MKLSSTYRDQLNRAAHRFGTPGYVYDLDLLTERRDLLRQALGDVLTLSYAVKANPNPAVLGRLRDLGCHFDASSIGEIERLVDLGLPPGEITFTGPGKRSFEIRRAVQLGIGGMVVESLEQARATQDCAATMGRRMNVLIRINPKAVPKAFGARMSGHASQFGIDEDKVPDAIRAIGAMPALDLIGLHIYAGSNSLSAAAIIENFGNMATAFASLAPLLPQGAQQLIFGSGFGIPYHPGQEEFDLAEVAAGLRPILRNLVRQPGCGDATCLLELGRWLVGPAGWLLTSVIETKRSGPVDFAICDAGFNTHLAACGMMGSVLRKPWFFSNVTAGDAGEKTSFSLVGPLCTSIDQLGRDVQLSRAAQGDVLCIHNSGAYGLTASPTRFISHPAPREVVLSDGDLHAADDPATLGHVRDLTDD